MPNRPSRSAKEADTMREVDQKKLSDIAGKLSIHHGDIEIIKDHETDEAIASDLEDAVDALQNAIDSLNKVLEA